MLFEPVRGVGGKASQISTNYPNSSMAFASILVVCYIVDHPILLNIFCLS